MSASGYVWLTNQVPPRITARRLLLVLGMGGFFVCAIAIPRAFEGNGIVFGLGYLWAVLVHAVHGRGLLRYCAGTRAPVIVGSSRLPMLCTSW